MSEAFDVIFAGGGTTACVVAGRLIAADPALNVLVIESGPHTRDVPHYIQPFRYVDNFRPDATTLANYPAQSSEHLNGRALGIETGRGVGGGSTINFMLYVRGAASDYDDWAAFGNKGWSFKELLPSIKKLETFTPIPGRSDTHGYSGPISVSARGIHSKIKDQFLSVAKEYDPDRRQVDDNNDFTIADAYSPAYQFTDPATGRRSDAASRYLYPHVANPNLTILVGKCVKRVIVEDGRAVGVEYTTDPVLSPGACDELVTVKANKLVVVSAGAFGSPTILERSGIGAPLVLEKYGIEVLVDLPGVGENYRDHIGSLTAFYASDEAETMDDVWENPGSHPAHLQQWEANGTGKISYNGAEAFVKVRPSKKELASAGALLQGRWETFFQLYPDKPVLAFAILAGCRSPSIFPEEVPIVDILSSFELYPESIGSIHITSSEDVKSPPDIITNFLSKDGDLAELALAYKLNRELLRRLPDYRGEVAAFHPKFPVDSPAACRETDVPVPIGAPDIVYSAEDDEAITNFHRDTVITTRHSLGTCAMKPRDQSGVVDARLNVYGVQGLKVADMSICPTNVGNNTYSTALLIGEKAASIIIEDLGL